MRDRQHTVVVTAHNFGKVQDIDSNQSINIDENSSDLVESRKFQGKQTGVDKIGTSSFTNSSRLDVHEVADELSTETSSAVEQLLKSGQDGELEQETSHPSETTSTLSHGAREMLKRRRTVMETEPKKPKNQVASPSVCNKHCDAFVKWLQKHCRQIRALGDKLGVTLMRIKVSAEAYVEPKDGSSEIFTKAVVHEIIKKELEASDNSASLELETWLKASGAKNPIEAIVDLYVSAYSEAETIAKTFAKELKSAFNENHQAGDDQVDDGLDEQAVDRVNKQLGKQLTALMSSLNSAETRLKDEKLPTIDAIMAQLDLLLKPELLRFKDLFRLVGVHLQKWFNIDTACIIAVQNLL